MFFKEWTYEEQEFPGQTVPTSAAKSRRGSLVKPAGSKFDNGLDLVAIQTLKPLHNVVDVGACFQIFKNDGDRHAGSAKYPGSAHLAWNAFDRRSL
jgi:hypothetical protein